MLADSIPPIALKGVILKMPPGSATATSASRTIASSLLEMLQKEVENKQQLTRINSI